MQELKTFRWIEIKLRKKLIVFSLIAAIGLIAYCNSFTAPFILDDFGSISNNYAIHHLFNFVDLWKFYANRIVLYFTLSINYFIHDNGVEGYHATNLAIHIFNGIILFLIIFKLLGLSYFKGKLLAKYRNTVSTILAVLFICHPIQVNAVTYIIQRTASLAAMFYFLAILFFIKFRLSDRLWQFLIMMLFIILAMFTKENTITIPFMLLLIELMFFLKDGKTTWQKRLLIFLLIFLTLPIIPGTNILLKGYSQSDPEVNFKASTSMDRMQYFYTELNVVILYIRLMFVPDRQNFDYSNDFPLSRTIWDNYSYVSFVLLALIGLYSLFTIKRNRLAAFGLIWFFTGLAVESSFISIKDVYFEHRLYFSCAGFIMFIVAMVFYERRPLAPGNRRYILKRPVLTLFMIAVVLTLAYTGLTLRRNYIYSDSIRLWSDVVSKAPGSDRAHCGLATGFLNAYDEKTKNTEYLNLAEKEFKKAIEINYYNSTAHCNLSKVYLLMGKYDECIDEALKTLSITKSEYADYNLGSAFKKMGRTKEALNYFLKGYKTNNKSTFILKVLGDTYNEMRDYKNARFYYEEYLKNSRSYENKDIRKKIKEIEKKQNP